MQHQGVVPEVITCNSPISVCEKGMQPARAMEIMEAMRYQGVVLEVITCNSLISICEMGMQPDHFVLNCF